VQGQNQQKRVSEKGRISREESLEMAESAEYDAKLEEGGRALVATVSRVE
jgi:hypothetical protein